MALKFEIVAKTDQQRDSRSKYHELFVAVERASEGDVVRVECADSGEATRVYSAARAHFKDHEKRVVGRRDGTDLFLWLADKAREQRIAATFTRSA